MRWKPMTLNTHIYCMDSQISDCQISAQYWDFGVVGAKSINTKYRVPVNMGFLFCFVTEAMLKNIKTGSTIEAMSIPFKYVSYIRW